MGDARPSEHEAGTALLQVQGVDVHLGRRGWLAGTALEHVLRDVSFGVDRGEIVGVTGETGSGKTTLARTILGLYDVAHGTVSFDGREISGLARRARRRFRRSGAIQVVFQDPLRSLDPDLSVFQSMVEGLRVQGLRAPEERLARCRDALEHVGLPAELLGRRPGQLSGGQRQRVSIARALVTRPQLLVCDEPVSSLDASNRNLVLQTLADVRRDLGTAMLVISHDLGSLAGIADRVVVLYQGSVVEEGAAATLFANPRHPYSALLVASAPTAARSGWGFDVPVAQLRRSDDGVPSPDVGCVFAPRCPFATEECWSRTPLLQPAGPDASVACHHHDTWRAGLEAVPAATSR